MKDGSDIKRYSDLLAKRCWLTGCGYIKVSKSGVLLVRQLIDAAVYSPERMIFEAKPTIGKGLVQDERASFIQYGTPLDTSKLLQLTESEEAEYQRLVAAAKLKAKPEAESAKKTYIDTEAIKLVKRGVPENIARTDITSSLENSVLYAHQQLQFQEHGVVTVADVLASPAKFNDCTLADPHEPEYHNNDKSVAKFFANTMLINSMAHGGRTYSLCESPPETCTKENLQLKVLSAINGKVLASDNAAQWIVDNAAYLDPVGEELLIDIVIKTLDLGPVKTALRKAIATLKKSIQSEKAKYYRLAPMRVQHDLSLPLDYNAFPDVDGKTSSLLATKANLVALLKGYGIGLKYDVIAKKQYLGIGEGIFCADLADNAKLAEIQNLCGLNQLPFKCMDYLVTLFASNAVNPVVDYLNKLEWNGKDNIAALRDLVTVTEESKPLWSIALKRWLIQCVAAADGAENTPHPEAKAKFEYCLTLVGKQGVNKTTFLGNLIPKALKMYFADGMHLDPANKDSVMLIIINWIVELGELDATFRKSDIARIKAFMSKTTDSMRLPYDKVESQFKRRTAFCGSVNDTQFLTDNTGSRRYWAVETLDLPTLLEIEKVVDIDQVWAQAWHCYRAGEIWWADDEMKVLVDASGERHATDNAVLDALELKFDLDNFNRGDAEFIPAGSLPERLGMVNGHSLARDIRHALESKGIERVKNRVNGYWLVERPIDED